MWFMVYERATGRPVSCGTVVAEPLPDPLCVAPVGEERPDFGLVEWDPATLSMEPLDGIG